MSDPKCWKCGAELKAVPQPFGRRAECPACHAELHVCRMCRHFTPGKAKQCMEPMAEEVKDKVRANFCEWFQPDQNGREQLAGDGDRSALEALFSDQPESSSNSPTDPRKALNDLFG